ncbi:MAG: hypothetical protein KA715_09025 [Xanthomonadaceae bacterium]|nr:hypothetical protein [Xanthomonadaceae bacterium]
MVLTYIGLDLGAGITIYPSLGSGAGFNLMFRPGFKFAKDSMFFEAKLGVLGSNFLFMPTVGVSF